jgi:hypothetical protein
MAWLVACSGSHAPATAADATDAPADAAFHQSLELLFASEHSVAIPSQVAALPFSSEGASGSETGDFSENQINGLAFDPATRLLFVGDDGAGISAARVDGSGALEPLDDAAFSDVRAIGGLVLAHGQLYAIYEPTSSSTTTITRIGYDGSGALSNAASISVPAVPVQLAFADDFAYVVSSSEIDGYAIGSDGALTPASTLAGSYASPVSDGAHLFAAGSGSIDTFAIGSDGSLMSTASIEASGIDALAISPDHTHLYAATDAATLAFALDGSGALTMIGSVASTGSYLMVAPQGRFVVRFATEGGATYELAVGSDGGLAAPIAGPQLGALSGAFAWATTP